MWRLIFPLCSLVAIATATSLSTSNGGSNVCNTMECSLSAEIIKVAMNESVDPCKDFYSYACGSWEANFPVPVREDLWNLDKMTERIALLEVKQILEEEVKDNDTVPLKYEKWFYKACLDEEKIEEAGLAPAQEVLDHLGGWPMSGGEEDRDWQPIHAFYTGYKELSALYLVNRVIDYENARKFMIEVAKPKESLYQKLMKREGDKEELLKRYEEFVKTVVSAFAKAANRTVEEEQLAKDVEELLAFENTLHQIRDLAKESGDLEPTQTIMTIEELQEFYDEDKLNKTAKINWLEAIRTLFKELDFITIEDNERAGVKDKMYLRTLSYLLNETPNRVIVNYIHWRFVTFSLKHLSKEMHDLYTEISKKPEDLRKIPERWEFCKRQMKMSMGYRYEYLKRFITPEMMKMGEDLASEVRGELLDEVDHSTWLDDDTKEETRSKLHDLKWFMGMSHVVPRRLYIEHMYDGMIITSDYFQNIQNVRKYYVNKVLSALRRRRWFGRRVDPMRAEVVYDQSLNMLVVLAAELSVSLLDPSVPSAARYGYLAPTLAQLMAKAMQKEVNTKTYVSPWSTDLGSGYLSYQTKTQCIKNQYQDYSVGPHTLDQNMFDEIGLKVAYNALKNSFDKSDEKLPGLENLSEDQLFFLSFASKYCRSATPEYLEKHDPAFHTPNEYRVIGPLSNSEHFARAFNCPADSPMNPDDKCTL